MKKRMQKLFTAMLIVSVMMSMMSINAYASSFTCGLAEHTHTGTDGSCYETQLTCGKHVHGEECYDAAQTQTCGEEVGKDLICTTEEHIHGDACYHKEHGTDCYHTHSAECYHVHGTDCYHQHDDACYEYTCGKEGTYACDTADGHQDHSACPVHVHDEACKTLTCTESVEAAVCQMTEGTLVCEYAQVADLTQPVCGIEIGTLTCNIGEHTHEDACYELHTHSESCNGKVLICGLDEHTHSIACLPTTKTEEAVEITKDKTATPLVNDITNVTLTVGGSSEELGVDIIYIVGSYASNSDGSPNVEGDVLISSLVDTMTEIVEAGVPVNFGMVPFSSDNVVAMELTTITEENLGELNDMIAEALATCEALYDGVNMENALIKSKKMFSESDLADHPERQHLVMITSGFTYFFNSGANNEYVSTVPVNFVHTDKKTVSNQLFYTNKAWQRARTAQTNTYPLPKVFTKYKDSKDWELYWGYIDAWAKADIAAGDKVVYEAATVEAGDFITWYNSGSTYAKGTAFGYNSHGAYITDISDVELSDYVTMYPTEDPLLENSNSAHAILYERAMWEAYEYSKANITGAGINFYPIYNALNANYTNGNWSPSDYGVNWTNQYIGHSFVNMLAGGEAVQYKEEGDKTFFDPIKKEIQYACSSGTRVEDFIGYDEEKGNFEFIQDGTITLKVGETTYTTAKLETAANDADSSYTFTAPGADEPTFTVDYYYGNGTTTERFVWTFKEDVYVTAPASLTYQLKLIDKVSEDGNYIVNTNNSATLHPVDSDGNKGEPKDFPIPEVNYTVGETQKPDTPNPPVTPPVVVPPVDPVTPPVEPPTVDVEEPDVPLEDLEIEDPTVEVEDPDVPLEYVEIEETDVPKTADNSNLVMWLTIAALSALALLGIRVTEGKRR